MKTFAILRHCIHVTILLLGCTACSNPQPGPDKTIGGTLLGAGWGTGVGAIVGNAVGNSPEGMAVGAAIGAVQGLAAGASIDLTEGALLDQGRELEKLRTLNEQNGENILAIRAQLDNRATRFGSGRFGTGGALVHQIPFDQDETSLRAGAITQLESVAENLKSDPAATRVTVVGHSDDEGTPEYNERVAEARARAVASYLGTKGLSMDRIFVQSFGSTRPVMSNATPEGRSRNRRVEIYIGYGPKVSSETGQQ